MRPTFFRASGAGKLPRLTLVILASVFALLSCAILEGCGFLKPIFAGPRDVIVANPEGAVFEARRLIKESKANPRLKPLLEFEELPESLRLPGLMCAIVDGDHIDLILAHNPDLTAGARIWSRESKRIHRDRPTKYPEIFFFQYNNDFEESPDNIR